MNVNRRHVPFVQSIFPSVRAISHTGNNDNFEQNYAYIHKYKSLAFSFSNQTF
jgi:hypothetical protein